MASSGARLQAHVGDQVGGDPPHRFDAGIDAVGDADEPVLGFLGFPRGLSSGALSGTLDPCIFSSLGCRPPLGQFCLCWRWRFWPDDRPEDQYGDRHGPQLDCTRPIR